VSTAIAPTPTRTLAPETGAAVRAAQEALEREAARVEVVNDPLGPVLRAVALALGACHRLYVDGSLTMARLAQDITSKPPIEKDEMRLSILNGIRATAGGAVRAITIRNWLLAACVLVGSNLMTAAAMWWWHPGVPVVQQLLVSLPAADERCEERDGGQVCYRPRWTKLPQVRDLGKVTQK
jgi:hypothetical protein